MATPILEKYRERLQTMRDRMLGEVESVVEAIHEDNAPAGELSHSPHHIADAAPEQLDADIGVIAAEQGVLEEIREALLRIDAGTFGKCTTCGCAIKAERLDALPFTASCVQCAGSRH